LCLAGCATGATGADGARNRSRPHRHLLSLNFTRCANNPECSIHRPNIALFVQCWSRCQLFKHKHPRYNPPLHHFTSIWI